jgi:uroporphyrinogen decarboxylase
METLRQLRKITSKDTEFVNEIIREVKRTQDRVPVIGFCGAPWTLFAYAVEGKGKADFKKAKLFMWERREEYLEFLGLLSENLVEYLKGRLKRVRTWCRFLTAGSCICPMRI